MFQGRATTISERGDPAGPELKPVFDEMGAFHEKMARNGVLLDGSCFRPSSQGWRQRYCLDVQVHHLAPVSDGKRTTTLADLTVLGLFHHVDAHEDLRAQGRDVDVAGG